MRSREEIQRSTIRNALGVDGSTKDSVEEGNKIIIEVLLDIRDLLQPPLVTIGTSKEFQRLFYSEGKTKGE